LIATLCFAGGMAGTGAFIWYGGAHKGSLIALLGIYFCYGLIMGIGLGTGYLSPVKTLMLWFSDKKGLATGLAVAGFGAAKAIASPIMEWMLTVLGNGGIYKMFFILSGVYFVLMFVGHLLLKKPDDWHEPTDAKEKTSILSAIKTRPIINYVGIWLMFYLNITCGLALISQEKMIIKCLGLAGAVGIISTISAIFNAGGRLGWSTLGDKTKDRNTIYKVIFLTCIVMTALVIVTSGIENGAGNTVLTILVLLLIMIVNAGDGGGFSNVPTLLSDHYVMGNISALHGITLSAWGFAGLTGNNLSTWIVNTFGKEEVIDGITVNPTGYQAVLYVTVSLYIVSFLLSVLFVKPVKKK
jgi:OFA family oxalate/formate antiporter-like MFS transporter